MPKKARVQLLQKSYKFIFFGRHVALAVTGTVYNINLYVLLPYLKDIFHLPQEKLRSFFCLFTHFSLLHQKDFFRQSQNESKFSIFEFWVKILHSIQ